MEPLPTTSGHRRPALPSRVTDHALLRYLERFEGVDVPGARARLDEQLGGRIADLLEFAGDAPFRIRCGADTFCGSGGRIVTCYRKGSTTTCPELQPGTKPADGLGPRSERPALRGERRAVL